MGRRHDPIETVQAWSSALVEVIDDLRTAFLVTPPPALRLAHLDAMVAAPRDGEARGAEAGRPRRRYGLAAAGVTAGVLLGATGIAGARGALPGPLQDAVATVVEPIGIDLPGGREPAADAPASTGTEVPPGIAGDGPTDPGRSGEAPGRTGDVPAQTGEVPSPAAGAPGQTGQTPAAGAPGQTGQTPAAGAPGQTGQTPAVTAPSTVPVAPDTTSPGGAKQPEGSSSSRRVK